MDSERERIQADLRGLLQGDVFCDDARTQLYAADASLYEVRPLGVVRPRHAADVVACVKYAADHGLPIHARGAGTGLAGESLGRGLVVDFAHGMRRIVGIDGDLVRVQPGVVHAQLNQFLAPRGKLFGPDPALTSVTTLGSVLALDGAGSHWLKYGSARGRVESLQVVLADGFQVEVNRHAVGPPQTPAGESDESRLSTLVRRVAEIARRESAVIEAHRPRALVNRSGYQLHNLFDGDELNLARLLVGSEGTLALITEATLRIDPLPKVRGVALLFCDRLDSAARIALDAARNGASACDLLDRRLLSIAREIDSRFERLIPSDVEAILLVEHQGDHPRDVRDALRQLIERAQTQQRWAFDARLAMERDEVDFVWQLASQVVSRLYSLRGPTRPLPFVEDLAVPPEELPDFFVRLQQTLKNHHTTASVFGHAGHGQLHIRPFLDLRNPDDVRKMPALATDLYREVLAVGGTISGEHGDGLSRSWFVAEQYGPLYEVFRQIKQLFDPRNLLNPGKVVADAPQPLTANLRAQSPVVRAIPLAAATGGADESASPAAAAPQTILVELHWEPDEMAQAATLCNGCGHCRTLDADARMCPIFRFAPREEASPRAKANLVRAVLTGQLPPAELGGEALKAVADLCVNCHQCRLECPANVDIPKLVLETKAQYVAQRGLPSADWFTTRLDRISGWASRLRPLVNWSLGNRQMRWLMEKVFGLAQGRKVPRLAARNFQRIAQRRRWTRPPRHDGRRVLYFVDTYANWYDTQLAESVVKVLDHNGVAAYVHPDQLPSGMPAITAGDVERVKPQVRANISLLAEAVRQGYTIVTSEPSAALCLTREYPKLFHDDDTLLVAANTIDIVAYLWRLHEAGKLELDLRPLVTSVGYHLPCHQRALYGGPLGAQLLRLIPGLSVQEIEAGCSGMAGTFGLKRQTYRASLRAGWGLITALRSPTIIAGSSECSACKMQMEQGTTKPTVHPVKLLALAYGLMPELAETLNRRGEDLFVT